MMTLKPQSSTRTDTGPGHIRPIGSSHGLDVRRIGWNNDRRGQSPWLRFDIQVARWSIKNDHVGGRDGGRFGQGEACQW